MPDFKLPQIATNAGDVPFHLTGATGLDPEQSVVISAALASTGPVAELRAAGVLSLTPAKDGELVEFDLDEPLELANEAPEPAELSHVVETTAATPTDGVEDGAATDPVVRED